MVGQHPVFVMSSLSSPPIFDTFHSNTTALSTEITTQILGYIIADARPSPLGGGVRTHAAHHPVASVSRAFRSIYVNHPYSTSTEGRETTPARLRIGEALEFSDLKTLSAFFEHGPGRDATTLHNVRFLSVSYLDDENATGWVSELPTMLTRLLSTFINAGVLCEYHGFDSVSLAHTRYLPSTARDYGASSSSVTFHT